MRETGKNLVLCNHAVFHQSFDHIRHCVAQRNENSIPKEFGFTHKIFRDARPQQSARENFRTAAVVVNAIFENGIAQH